MSFYEYSVSCRCSAVQCAGESEPESAAGQCCSERCCSNQSADSLRPSLHPCWYQASRGLLIAFRKLASEFSSIHYNICIGATLVRARAVVWALITA